MKTATPFDISEYLDTEEKISAYLTAVMEDNDLGFLLRAIGDVAKARGMSKIAQETGLGRESLYKTFAENAQPKFDTVIRVLHAMNISIEFKSTTENSKKPMRSNKRPPAATTKKKLAA